MPILGVNTKARPLGTYRQPAQDLDLDRLQLRGPRDVVVNLKRSTSSVELLQTIEGASTLTIKVRDYSRHLLRSALPRTRSTLVLDNIEFTLVKVAHEENEITLIFEETAINLLRRDSTSTPKKANRANTTRAQFIRGMINEVTERRIPFQCPEEKVRQPITPPIMPETS